MTRSAELALRAYQLATPRQRLRLAKAVDAVVAVAGRTAAPLAQEVRPLGASAPIRRAEARRCRPLLLSLSARLREGPARVEGIARTSRLLGDGRGPLYLDDEPLEDALRAALHALDLRSAEGDSKRPDE